jgi:hypothetical protein
VSNEGLDIVAGGFTFRFSLLIPVEAILLKNLEAQNKSVENSQKIQDWDNFFVHQSAHSRYIFSLHHFYPTFSSTCQ